MTGITQSLYWKRRKDLAYYRQARNYARVYCPAGRSLLDVGGGIGLGCRYLEWFGDFQRTSVELPSKDYALAPVRVIHEDFLTWTPDRRYDLVLCLQVLEHVPDPVGFAQKLFRCGPVVIISVPYGWPAGACKQHIHDPVDQAKLRSWTGREPLESVIVNSRLLAVYKQSN